MGLQRYNRPVYVLGTIIAVAGGNFLGYRWLIRFLGGAAFPDSLMFQYAQLCGLHGCRAINPVWWIALFGYFILTLLFLGIGWFSAIFLLVRLVSPIVMQVSGRMMREAQGVREHSTVLTKASCPVRLRGLGFFVARIELFPEGIVISPVFLFPILIRMADISAINVRQHYLGHQLTPRLLLVNIFYRQDPGRPVFMSVQRRSPFVRLLEERTGIAHTENEAFQIYI